MGSGMSKNKRRAVAESVHDHKYHLVNGERGPFSWLCVYCGMPADTKEHYPPISRVSDYESLGGVIFIKFPCCSHCNSIAGSYLDDTILARIERVKDRMQQKWNKRFKAEEWDDEEFEELGRNLQSYVSTETAKDLKLKNKIEYYVGIDTLIDQIYLIYGDDYE